MAPEYESKLETQVDQTLAALKARLAALPESQRAPLEEDLQRLEQILNEHRPVGRAQKAAGERDAYLVRLADTLRPLEDPVAIQAEAARLLGEHLRVSRVMYGEVADNGADLVVERNFVAPGAPLLAGRFHMADFGPALVDALNAGYTIVIPEIAASAVLSPAERAAFASLGISALVGVPLTKGGRFVANLNVHHDHPHAWTTAEVTLIEETAECTWAAVERARAQKALRESVAEMEKNSATLHEVARSLEVERGKLAAVLENLPVGVWIADPHGRLISTNEMADKIWSGSAPLVDSVAEYGHYTAWFADNGKELLPEEYPVARALSTGQAVDPVELRIRAFDGAERFVLVSAAPINDHEGNLTGVVGINLEITERKKAEQTLRESEERKAYLLKLNDAISTIKDPVEIQEVAARLIAEHLHLDRAHYTEVTEDEQWGIIHKDYVRNNAPTVARKYPLNDYAVAVEHSRYGPLVVNNIPESPLFDDKAKEDFARSKVAATCLFALYKDGKRVAHFTVNHTTPRNWTPLEVSLVQETAERTWAAIERARAEKALRASEERFRTSIESLNEAFVIFSTVRAGGQIVDFRFEFVNEEVCKLYQRPREQIEGQLLLALYPQYLSIGLFDIFVQVIETGRPFQEQFIAFSEQDGNPDNPMAVFDVRASKFGDSLIVTSNDATEQMRLEEQHRQVRTQMEIHHRLTEQRERERQRYARDIHDGPIQTLSSLVFSLQYLKETYEHPALADSLDEIVQGVKAAVQELRQLMNELRPPNVLRFGLAKAIQVHVEGLRERHPELQWRLDLEFDSPLLPEQTCLALFRIYQEATNNIIRHAGAAHASVCYRVQENQAVLEIADDGRGFTGIRDIFQLTSQQHFGLAGINEWVEAIQGKLEIVTEPGQGLKLKVTAPVGTPHPGDRPVRA